MLAQQQMGEGEATREQKGLGRHPGISRALFAVAWKAKEAKEEETKTES